MDRGHVSEVSTDIGPMEQLQLLVGGVGSVSSNDFNQIVFCPFTTQEAGEDGCFPSKLLVEGSSDCVDAMPIGSLSSWQLHVHL